MNFENFFKMFRSPSSGELTNIAKNQWRTNMWVITPDGIGILFTLDDPTCSVHLVNDDGTTKIEMQYPLTALRQAKHLEIPTTRRHPDEQVARNLGYL